MNTPLNFQTRLQQLLITGGMLYALLQLAILVFAGMSLLPLLGPADAPGSQIYQAYANHTHLFRIGNYLMVLPPLFFYLFLGGLYAYFHSLPEGVKGILCTVLLSGAVLIMIWPLGAVLSLLGVQLASQGGDRLIAITFDSIVPGSLALSTIPRTIFLFSLSVLLLRQQWLAITGFVLAAMSLSGSLLLVFGAPFLPLSLGSTVLFQLWIFSCSLTLFASMRRQSRVATQPKLGVKA